MQLPFSLDSHPSYLEDDYIVSNCNRLAMEAIREPTTWPNGRLLVVGPAGSGKTHLARIWANRNSARIVAVGNIRDARIAGDSQEAVVIEDIHLLVGNRLKENHLFDVINAYAANGRLLLLTARGRINSWGISLADLESRLIGGQVATIGDPDDNLTGYLLMKLLADRQISLSQATIRYISRQCERSFQAIGLAVEDLDRMSLASGRKISRKMVAEYYASQEAGPTGISRREKEGLSR